VNSSLQRARAQLDQAGLSEDDVVEPVKPDQRDLLDRYCRALEDKNIPVIVELFTADAVWEMPPFVGWYQGPADIGTLIETQCPAGPGGLRTVPTEANGQPAFGVYILGDDGGWHAFQLQVLTLDGARISHATVFFDLSLFPKFGLAMDLPADDQAPVTSDTP
jgi:RNA polymerase sigma-70 factor, ECF subfamily